jgi:hypothetical protein
MGKVVRAEIKARIRRLKSWQRGETHAPSKAEIQKVIDRLEKSLLTPIVVRPEEIKSKFDARALGNGLSDCTRCKKLLHPDREIYLELDARTNTYTDGPVQPKHSQGCFPFGLSCAVKEVTKHRRTKARTS